ELWVSVLDSATTPLCRSQSNARRSLGGEWSTGYRGPDPPAHFNCRSVLVPMLSSEIPDILNYEEWLATLPVAEQIEILGPSRHKLWSAGRLTLDRFVNDFGKSYTLDQLRERDAAAFARAGL